MADILYEMDGKLYVNLTNKCPCHCRFCIRENEQGVGSADSLWHEHDPDLQEILAAFEERDLSSYSELVFCGYGEPLCALDNLLAVCRAVKSRSDIPIRLNTNGLGDLIHKRPTAFLLEGLLDSVSVSLNAPSAAQYNDITRPCFGEEAFYSMLHFAEECKRFVPHVQFSVVDVISKEDIARCRKLADSLQIPLRVRHYSK